ncbi:MAG: fused MFS/spermidine synthase [Gallionella sp.]|nr:fused MFS/spermidine synthase [Gallionella sp.]MDD4958951.1 fused MFS/spermidine synthase [Gallionella sp.]
MWNKLWVVLAVWILGSHAAVAGELYTAKSLYRNIVVYEEDQLRCIKFGRYVLARQSCIRLSNRDELVFDYTKMMMSALYFNPSPKRILIIGLGGGTLPSTMQKLFPSSQVDAVEIDPVVIDVAKRFFYFTPTKQMRVFEADGRVFVKRALKQKEKYDLVMLDAFDHEYIPEHMLTKEFLQEVRGLLTEKGVLAANTFSSSRLYNYESATYYSVFGDFYAIQKGNRVIVLRMGGLPSTAELKQNAELLESRLRPLGVGKNDLLPKLTISKDWPADTKVLTDQYSPSNLLNVK